jgi:hypothetical protein
MPILSKQTVVEELAIRLAARRSSACRRRAAYLVLARAILSGPSERGQGSARPRQGRPTVVQAVVVPAAA